jgi:hypothetical protein
LLIFNIFYSFGFFQFIRDVYMWISLFSILHLDQIP